MNKIKLPLRVCLYSDQLFVKHWYISDSKNKKIAKFEDEQTAKLFADCFYVTVNFGNMLFDRAFFENVVKNAKDAVEDGKNVF